MTNQVEQALAALLKQVTTITERLDAQDKKFEQAEERYANTKKINTTLLNRLKGPKEGEEIKPEENPTSELAKLLAAVDMQTKERQDKLNGFDKMPKATDPVQISKQDALDVRKYAEAKAEADKRGVALEILDIDAQPAPNPDEPDLSVIDEIEDKYQKVRYVKNEIAMGGAGFVQNSMAAERDGFQLRTFQSIDELPEHIQQKATLMAAAHEAQGGNDADA